MKHAAEPLLVKVLHGAGKFWPHVEHEYCPGCFEYNCRYEYKADDGGYFAQRLCA